MNAKLIMLPNPILVSDEKPLIDDYDYSVNYATVTKVDKERAEIQNLPSYKGLYKKIIAGIEGLPILDLSVIAEKIGWVDVEKLAEQQFPNFELILKEDWHSIKNGFVDGFKAAQSLNEKKWVDNDMIDFHNFIFNHPNQFLKMGEYLEEFKKSRKPKEYNVIANLSEDRNSYIITQII